MLTVSYTPEEEANLAACQAVLGYPFQNLALLREALTHSSGAATPQQSNERLEFLGDAVLGLICVQYLFERFPNLQEGDMTHIKSEVVSRDPCAKFCDAISLWQFMFAGRGMVASKTMPVNIKADLFEAVVGAIYLDGQMAAAEAFVLKFLIPEIASVSDAKQSNPKSYLQQIAQQQFGSVPKYNVLDMQGPEHQKSFKIAVTIGKKRFAAAWGTTKRTAEARAAENAIAQLENQPLPHDQDPS